jgi:flagellar basal-body rod protein FlgG
LEAASAILSASERTLEATANNVANVSTPGFKRQVSFGDVVSQLDSPSRSSTRPDLTHGKLSNSGNLLDLAITGDGYFQLRSGPDIFYSRQGTFSLSEDGTVVNSQGLILQKQGGGDMVLYSAEVTILEDVTFLSDGRPVGRAAIFTPVDANAFTARGGSLFEAPEEAMEETGAAGLRQGMVETSNVTLGDEMVAMMAAVRQAESGSRLVQYYDDLVGRAITTFGAAGR